MVWKLIVYGGGVIGLAACGAGLLVVYKLRQALRAAREWVMLYDLPIGTTYWYGGQLYQRTEEYLHVLVILDAEGGQVPVGEPEPLNLYAYVRPIS